MDGGLRASERKAAELRRADEEEARLRAVEDAELGKDQLVAVSRDGATIATSEAYRSSLEVRRPDGTPVGSTGPDGEADDADGYLHPNEPLEAVAFSEGGDHGI